MANRKKKKKPVKPRNPYALHAKQRKAVVFKDKRQPKGGQKNTQAEYLEEDE